MPQVKQEHTDLQKPTRGEKRDCESAGYYTPVEKTRPDMTEVIAVLDDFELFCKYCLYIKDKEGNIVPFVLNEAQKAFYKIYQKTKELGLPLRFIILKARQKGLSTLIEAIIFWETVRKKNRTAVIIGHVAEASENLFQMSKRYYRFMPKGIRVGTTSYIFKPPVEASNKKEVKFGLSDSSIRVLTAGNDEDTGRSATIQYLHATECAFWGNAKATLVALLQTVPDIKDSLVVLESTANGIGGEFYNRWQDAVKGESQYQPVFISWLIDSEYTLSFQSPWEKKNLEDTLTETEKLLIEKGATLEHLNWRRKVVKDKCGGDEAQFAQEYPSDDVEAFIASGRPVFDSQICQMNLQHSRPPAKEGYLEYMRDDKDNVVGVAFIEQKGAPLKIWTDFTVTEGDQHRFCAGCDVAEGLEQGDYSVIRVLDRRTMEVCMTWHGHTDPDLLAEEQYKISLFLKNDITFNTESNNHGLTTITSAFKLGVNQYYKAEYSKGYEVTSTQLGSKTSNSHVKKLYIDRMNEWIREGIFTDYERDFWTECQTFVRNEKGQMQAQGKDKDPSVKCFDDRVMACAMMIIVAMWLPSYRPLEKEEIVSRSYIKRYMRRGKGASKF